MDNSGDRNAYRVLGRRVVWSPWWWLTVAGVVLAAVLVFAWPVGNETEHFGTTECGTLLAPESGADGSAAARPDDADQASECENLRGVHWQLILAVLATSAVPAWLGRRDNRYADVGPSWVLAALCVGASVFLLVAPTSSGQLYQCGSPLLRTVDTLQDYEGEDALDNCSAAWSGRVAWSALLVTAAVPLAASAARGPLRSERG